jgi:hypothetical protein
MAALPLNFIFWEGEKMDLNETHTTYEQSMCEMQIAVDKGFYPIEDGTSLDTLAQLSVCANMNHSFYSTCIPRGRTKERIDIERIRSEVFRLLGCRIIDLSISVVTSHDFKSDNNEDCMGILIRSYSNRYVRDHPETFGDIIVSDYSDEKWRETFVEVAKYLKKKLGKNEATYWCSDLPKAGSIKVIPV